MDQRRQKKTAAHEYGYNMKDKRRNRTVFLKSTTVVARSEDNITIQRLPSFETR